MLLFTALIVALIIGTGLAVFLLWSSFVSHTDRSGAENQTDPPPTDLEESGAGKNSVLRIPEKSSLLQELESTYRNSSQEGRDFVRDLANEKGVLAVYRRLGELDSVDPEAAINFANSITNDEAMEAYFRGFVNQLAASDPEFALNVHLANEGQFSPSGSIRVIFDRAVEAGNAKKALYAVRKYLPQGEHSKWFRTIYSSWATTDPMGALANLENRPESKAREAGVRGFFDAVAKTNRDFLDQWMKENGDHPFFPVADREFQESARGTGENKQIKPK